MTHGVWVLLSLRFRGWARRVGRSLLSVKGIILTVIGLSVFAPQLVVFFVDRGKASLDSSWVDRFVPWVMLAMCLLTLLFSKAEQAIYFTPAEVTFLFPAPLSRRTLMVSKLVAQMATVSLSALVMSIFMVRSARWWPAAYVGIYMALWFFNLFTIAVMMVSTWIGAAAFTWRRRVGFALLGLILLGGGYALFSGVVGQVDAGMLQRIENSPVVAALLTPFRWITHTFTSARLWPDLIGWGGLSLLVNLSLCALILLVDAQYLEQAAAASEKLYARIERMRKGTPALAFRSPSKRKKLRTLPALPWWGGAGPVAWRQASTGVRDLGRAVVLLIIYGSMTVPLVVAMSFGKRSGSPSETPIAFIIEGLVLGVGFILPTIFTLDFRGDIDRMDMLKALPVKPSALVLGQIATPIVLLTLSQWLAILIVGLVAQQTDPLYWAVATLAVPLMFLLVAVENLLFLWFPFRAMAHTPGDFQTMGRGVLLMLAKLLMLAVFGGLGAALGAVVYFLLGRQLIAVVAVLWFALAAGGAALVPLLTVAFRQFDVARDTAS